MKPVIKLVYAFLLVSLNALAQSTEIPLSSTEQQLEDITERNAESGTEDDSFLQQLAPFKKHPVNLNTADEIKLAELKLINPVQVENLLSYRSLLGKLISIYELQAIPGWDLNTIHSLRPYVKVGMEIDPGSNLLYRIKNGEHSLLMRTTQVLEKSKGYRMDPSAAKNYYPGSPQHLLLRYKSVFKNLFQFGITAEKDPGEQFFRGKQKAGFDFYSAHIFLRDLGVIRSLALGDYTINFGQGLIQWQSLAFKKGADLTGCKRQSAVLAPYRSAGEINFHRGIAITIGKNNWEATLFGSYRKLDANFIPADSTNTRDFISSLQTSGYHRTAAETDDKNIQNQLAFGSNFAVRFRKIHIGMNCIQYRFKYPLIKDALPYNKFSLSGSNFGNMSVDYSYTMRNIHFFGELASTNKLKPALVSGLLISLSPNMDMSLFYRNISREYQSLNSNAFIESTSPSNEKGLYAGISLRPVQGWQLDAYVDFYKFPWLRYQLNGPTIGSDYLVQAAYRPNRSFELISRFKMESKPAGSVQEGFAINPVFYQPKQNWRLQFQYKVSSQIIIRSRTEMTWFDKNGMDYSRGFLLFADVIYKPMLQPLSAGVRLQYFETDDYNSRIYASENDLLYTYSIPVFYEKGYRYYINLNYDLSRNLSVWGRISQTIYPGKTFIGSGLDEINGNRKTEVKIQVEYRFR